MGDKPDADGPAKSSEPLAPLPSSPANPLSDEDAAYEAYARYEKTWDLAHLDNSILIYQRTIDTAPQPDQYLLGWLGYCLGERYRNRGKLKDLERSIAACRDALHLIPDEHPDKALRLNNLGSPLRRRYERLGELNDLKSAITMQLRSVELTPADHPDLSARLDNLGYLQCLQYDRFGELDDLERSIANRQRAVDLVPDEYPDKPIRLNNLGLSLRRRFERLGEPDDLERAVTVQHRAVELAPEGHPDLPAWLDNLGSLQYLRYERFGDLKDLEHAIVGQQRAVDLTPDGHPLEPRYLSNLGMSLRARFERLREPDDLERAITAQRRAVEHTPEGHPEMPAQLDNLGQLQLLRYERFRNLDDLECAIAAQQRVVKSTPDAHPLQGRYLNNLGATLAARISTHQTHESFEEAISCFTEAAALPLGSATERLIAAKWGLRLHADHPDLSTVESLMLAHSRIFDIIPELVWLGHSVTRRLEESQHLASLVSAAIHTAITVGDLSRAVEWLDAGRSFIWAQVLSLRSPVEKLAQLDPELARSLERVLAQLQSSIHIQPCRESASEIDGRSLPISASNSEADRHRALAIEYGKLLSEVRCQPGFESFMCPKKLSSLLGSPTLSGTVVFINVDKTRCDAVILGSDGKITSLTLLELTLDKAEKLRFQWQSYLLLRNVRQRSTMTHSSLRHRKTHTSAVRLLSLVWRRVRTRSMAIQHRHGSGADARALSILHCLWKWVVHPVLEVLGLLDGKGTCDPLPHLTWCPTGPLTQLPLHAAGVYGGNPGPRIYDYVVSSYTPSLSALTRCVNGLVKRQADPSVLVVTQSNTPGMASLPGATIEGKRLQEVFSSSGVESTLLEGKQASTETVRGVLDNHSWLHLACHGSQNADNPLQSAFALHDGPLSLIDLMSTSSDNAELAFLSACQTAVGDEKIPEESMHLAAGMLAVGFKGVIATMWSIRDDDAPLVVEAYYKKLLELRASGTLGKGETGAAYALHEATKQLREKTGEKEVARWAPFVHFGI